MHAPSLDDINLISDRSYTEAEQHLLPAKCETKKVSGYVYFIYPYEKKVCRKSKRNMAKFRNRLNSHPERVVCPVPGVLMRGFL